MEKRQNIEYLRLLSAFGIVWFHSGTTGHEVSYAALVVFVILSAYFSGNQSRSIMWIQVQRRFNRLLIPWATWFIIYSGVNVLGHKSLIPLENGIISGVLSGPSSHLWYMPYIFGCLMLLDILARKIPPNVSSVSSAAFAALILALAPLWRQHSIELGYPLAQYVHASAGIFIGTFFRHFHSLSIITAILLFACITLAAASAMPISGVGLPYLLGILLAMPLISVSPSRIRFASITVLSECTLGIYFVHPLFLKLANKLSPSLEILLPIVAFSASAIAVLIFRRAFPTAAKYWS